MSRSIPLGARIYIIAVLAAAVLFAVVCALWFPPLSLSMPQMTLLVVVICLADFYPIALPQESNAEVTVSCAIKTAAAIALGPCPTLIITFLGTLIAETLLHRAWYKVAFNAAEMTVTFGSMSVIYQLLYDGTRAPFHSAQNAWALAAILLTYYVINTGLVTMVVSLSSGISLSHIWRVSFRDTLWNNLTIIPLGAVTATLWLHQPWSILALVLPTIAVRQSFQYIADLQKQTREALVGMADAIDRRDPNTYQHSQRVAIIASALCEQIGFTPEDAEVVRMAARLHDLGKIGMGNALLHKPGRFDAEEQAEFRLHPLIGAELVKGFRLFREGQDLILYHHERYDGKGYPTGLAGEDIPLGSRILAVADSLDAMTSRRVYREPVNLREAVDEVLRNSGAQFDPQVAQALVGVVERWQWRLPWSDDPPAPQPSADPVRLSRPVMPAANLNPGDART